MPLRFNVSEVMGPGASEETNLMAGALEQSCALRRSVRDVPQEERPRDSRCW